MTSKRLAARAAALVLLLCLPLAWTPLSEDLRPQKSLVFGLALPLCAFAAPSLFAAVTLTIGFAYLALAPDAPWEVLAIAAAPSVFALLRSLLSDDADRAFVFALVRRAAITTSLAAIGGAIGLLPFDTSAFHLPYRVFVGTLGNPNHLAAYLLLALPISVATFSSPHSADRLEASAAIALSSLVVLLSRSHLAALVLAAEAYFLTADKLPRTARAAVCLVPIAALVLAPDGFVRALEGRVYLHAVHARGFSLPNLLAGLGAGEIGPRFLDWQAGYLAAHPEDRRFWTYPEHPHDDLIALLLTLGIVTTTLGFVLARKRLTLDTLLPRGSTHAAWSAVLLLALGQGLLPSPVTLAMAMLVAAASLRPRTKSHPQKWLAFASALVSIPWFVVTLLEVVSAYHHREALRAAVVDRDLARALQHAESALSLPFYDRGKLLHLRGRILLEANRPLAAASALQASARATPHPMVWKALTLAETMSNNESAAREAESKWRFYAPNDPALVTSRR